MMLLDGWLPSPPDERDWPMAAALEGVASLPRGFSGGLFVVRNSWGGGWAQNGEARISLATISTLLALGTHGLCGEAWAAKEAA